MKGTVKFFNSMKGFGFIAGDDGKEVFVHQTALAEGETLNENDAVEFDVEQGDKGPKAANVHRASAGASESSESEDSSEEAEESSEAEDSSEESDKEADDSSESEDSSEESDETKEE